MTNTKTDSLDLWPPLKNLRKDLIPLRGSKGEGRNKWIKEHLNLYIKSGILDWFAKSLRKEFKIPNLDPVKDLEKVQIPIGAGNYLDDMQSKWFYDCENQYELEAKIEKVLKILYLPREFYDIFLDFLLYRKLRIPKFINYDDELVAEIMHGHKPKGIILGYSGNELKKLGNKAIYHLYIEGEDSSAEVQKEIEQHIELIPSRIEWLLKENKRNTRQAQNIENDLKVIRALKKYKKIHNDFDIVENKETTFTTTSRELAMEIFNLYEDAPEKHKSLTDKQLGDWFRQRKRRLLERYPFLPDFISNKNAVIEDAP